MTSQPAVYRTPEEAAAMLHAWTNEIARLSEALRRIATDGDAWSQRVAREALGVVDGPARR